MDNQIKKGDVLTSKELSIYFKCSNQGGMRRSHRTNSLVLISNHTNNKGDDNPYDDRWKNDVFHYTGMGSQGDQSLDFRQNKTLYESETNGVEVHLFEVFKPQQYEYKGQVALADKPYQDRQPDVNNSLRKVWIFPLKITGGTPS